ncbi:MAG: arsenite-activated ATPase ArsA [uncultured archaeon A07HR60]|nr:MAG: arsenite-activated ATPase ArsA [uncultured archaeon A07HR60]
MTEFVLYGGKGGVGKTTLAAATGMRSARSGARTLVVSTDPAHSLADAYECRVGETPTRISDDSQLYGLEINPRDRFRERYGDTFEELIGDAQSLGVDISEDDVSDVSERGLVPGADELAVVDLFAEYDDHPDWEVVVFDTAPTGHTLRLLSLPDVMNTTVGKLISLKGGLSSVTNTVRGLIGSSGDDSRSGSSYSSKMDQMQSVMEDVSARLRDGRRTEFRAVTIPERMAIAETERLLTRLDETGISVESVLINKVLQDASEDCPTCWPRYQNQLDIIEEAKTKFDPPVREVPLVTETDGRARVEEVTQSVEGVKRRKH